MCSVCWEWGGSDDPSLKIIFNRDEQRSREIAEAPQLFEVQGTKVLMPTDPAGGGSWIASNEYGLAVALLNKYEVAPVADRVYKSRGFVVKSLSACQSLAEASERLKQMVGENAFPAFSLLLWNLREQRVELFEWDGVALRLLETNEPFMTSSSWNTAEVQKYRQQCYRESVIEGAMRIEGFMKTPPTDKLEWSVLMQREKTQTVSVSELSIDAQGTRFLYTDCNTLTESNTELSHKN